MLHLVVFLSLAIFGASTVDIQAIRQHLLSSEDFIAAKDQCVAELKTSPETLAAFEKNHDELSEDMSCFIKCIQEKNGFFDDNKMLDVDKIESLPFFSLIDQNKKDEVLGCLKELGPLETCADIEKERTCVEALKN